MKKKQQIAQQKRVKVPVIQKQRKFGVNMRTDGVTTVLTQMSKLQNLVTSWLLSMDMTSVTKRDLHVQDEGEDMGKYNLI